MTDGDHFQQIEENFSRVFNRLEALAIQIADVKATGERIEARLERTESTLNGHMAETRASFARMAGDTTEDEHDRRVISEREGRAVLTGDALRRALESEPKNGR